MSDPTPSRVTTPNEGQAAAWDDSAPIDAPLRLHSTNAPPEWMDYNDHMSESCFLLAFGDSADAFFRFIGIDEAYRAGGHSLYTTQTHLHHRQEVSLGEPLVMTLQVLDHDHRRLHIYHEMRHGETDALIAMAEQLLVHVDMEAGSLRGPAGRPVRAHRGHPAGTRRAAAAGRGRPPHRHQAPHESPGPPGPPRITRTTQDHQGPQGAVMDFGLDDEQRAIVDTVRTFVQRELYPHEEEVERTNQVTPELAAQIRKRAIDAGLHAANMPEEHRRRRPRRRQHDAGRARAGQGQLRPAVAGGPPRQHPAGVRGRPAGALPAAGRARRALRLPGDDRAGRGLRRTLHDHAGGARR